MKLNDLLSEKFTDISPQGSRLGGHSRALVQGSYDLHDAKWKLMRNYFRENEWYPLGSGHFSTVFYKPNSPWVLKVLLHKDQGFFRFYTMAKKSQNPHFPNYGRLGVMDVPDDLDDSTFPVYVVMIEKLEERNNPDAIELADDIKRELWKISRLPERIVVEYPQLNDAIQLMRPLVKNYELDIRADNILWRGNTPVISDPIYNHSDIRSFDEDVG